MQDWTAPLCMIYNPRVRYSSPNPNPSPNYRRTSSVGATLTELNGQLLAERRIAHLVMFYKIHYHLVAIITMHLESKDVLVSN